MKTTRPLAQMGLLCALVACVPHHDSGDFHGNPPGDLDVREQPQGTTVGGVTGCSLAPVRGLDQQIVDETNCLEPGALVDFTDLDVSIGGSSTWPLLQQEARDGLAGAISARGQTFAVNTAYRTIVQQFLLYQWYLAGECGIGLAAQPGRSNHQSGLALDVSDYDGWRSHMEANGWSWLGNSDPVHFDYEAGGTDIRGTAVLAFQRLWNRNNPGDVIVEDGLYGPQTEARLRMSPADGFTTGASCDPDPPADAEITLSTDIVPVGPDAGDLVNSGSSTDIVDVVEGSLVELVVTVRHGRGRPASDDITLGYEVTGAAVEIEDYYIESDFPALDGTSWAENDANTLTDNPRHGLQDRAGSLNMARFSSGESKRVTLLVRAVDYDQARPRPLLRAWIRDAGDYWSEQTSWDDPVENDQASEPLRQERPLDVFAGDRWSWEGGQSDDLEGWTSCSGEPAAVETSGGLLVATADACLQSPNWTSIDRTTHNGIAVTIANNAAEPGTLEVWWAGQGQELAAERSATIDVAGNAPSEEIFVPAGDEVSPIETLQLQLTGGVTLDAVRGANGDGPGPTGEVGQPGEDVDSSPDSGGFPDVGTPMDAESSGAGQSNVNEGCGCHTVSSHPAATRSLPVFLLSLALVVVLRRRAAT